MLLRFVEESKLLSVWGVSAFFLKFALVSRGGGQGFCTSGFDSLSRGLQRVQLSLLYLIGLREQRLFNQSLTAEIM